MEVLWGASSVGVIGGAPKCAKTWLGLDMALSVATGTACLGKYAVPEPGPVLVYLAEDALPVVRERIAGMARHRGLDLGPVEIARDHGARTPARSRPGPGAAVGDDPAASTQAAPAWIRWCDCTASTRTVPAKWPSYWLTFARCSGEFDLSVLLVHHTRKNAAGGVAAGQGLRGSGDIHAFGDSNLYLRRTREHLVLSSEHRAAPAATSVNLELVATDAQTTHLEVIGELRDGATSSPTDGKPAQPRGTRAGPSGPGRDRDAGEAPGLARGQERAFGRGAGVAGASRPALPHARWLATPGLTVEEGRSRSP